MTADQLNSATYRSSPALNRHAWVEPLTVTLIVAVGCALRLLHLGTWSFWPDELFSFGVRSDGFNNSFLRRSLATDLIGAAVGLLGPSEFNARLVPALIGVLTIPLLYLLLRRCLPRPGALFVIALLALSPWHIYWSQNARFYTLLFLFFNLGLLFFHLGLEEDKPWYMAAAVVLFGLAARERLVALLGIPALVVYVLLLWALRWDRPKGLNRRNLLVFFGPAFAAGAVMVLPYAADLGGWMQGFGRINNSPFFLAAGTLYYIGLPLAVFAAGSGLYLAARKQRAALLFGLTAVLPLALLMALSLLQYTANRYIFFSLFSWLVLAGLGFAVMWSHLARAGRIWAFLVAGVLLAGALGELFQYYTLQNGNRDDWRSAFAYIAQHGSADDTVVGSDFDVFDYYLGAPFQYRRWGEPLPEGENRRTWYVEDMTVAELFPAQLAEVVDQAEFKAEYDVRLPGRTYRMRVYLMENP